MNRNAFNFRRLISYPILTCSLISSNGLWMLLDFFYGGNHKIICKWQFLSSFPIHKPHFFSLWHQLAPLAPFQIIVGIFVYFWTFTWSLDSLLKKKIQPLLLLGVLVKGLKKARDLVVFYCLWTLENVQKIFFIQLNTEHLPMLCAVQVLGCSWKEARGSAGRGFNSASSVASWTAWTWHGRRRKEEQCLRGSQRKQTQKALLSWL